MCHHLSWEEWELLRFEERREEEEPRVIEVTAEPDEALEAEPERDRERELIRA
jgi:negative regulator of sigma E activity